MEERYSQYSLVKAKNGFTIPYINDVYLHSMYDPEKEAEGFAKMHGRTLESKRNIVILGLGFGYHVEAVASTLGLHYNQYKIIVIEPNEKLYKDFCEEKNFKDNNIIAIHTTSYESLFSRRDFVEFLLSRPAILKHDTSFMLNKDFFTGFLSYRAGRNLEDIANISQWSNTLLSANDQTQTLESYTQKIMGQKSFEDKDLLYLAFNEIVNSNEGTL